MYGKIVVVLRGPLDVDSHGLMEGRYTAMSSCNNYKYI